MKALWGFPTLLKYHNPSGACYWVGGGGVDSKSKYPSIGPFPGIFRVTETSRRLLVFVENTEVSLTMGGWAGSKSTEKRPLRVSKTKKTKKKNIYRSDTGASKVQRFIKEQWCWITPLLRCLGVSCGGSWGLASCDNLKELHLVSHCFDRLPNISFPCVPRDEVHRNGRCASPQRQDSSATGPTSFVLSFWTYHLGQWQGFLKLPGMLMDH